MAYLKQRINYIRFFTGCGLDIGSFDKPFIPNPAQYNLKVNYVDRFSPSQLKQLFPDIPSFEPITPDYICDISSEGLPFAQNESYDFVICSHVLEHVANPFFLIMEIYRILKEKGIFYLAIPDSRFSDDYGRPQTTYLELVDLLHQDVRSISDEQVCSYIQSPKVREYSQVKDVLTKYDKIPKIFIETIKNRSLHVHVWESVRFFHHICQFITEHSVNFSLLDLAEWEDNGYEAVLLLRKDHKYSPHRLLIDLKNLYLIKTGKELPVWDKISESNDIALNHEKTLFSKTNQNKKWRIEIQRYKQDMIWQKEQTAKWWGEAQKLLQDFTWQKEQTTKWWGEAQKLLQDFTWQKEQTTKWWGEAQKLLQEFTWQKEQTTKWWGEVQRLLQDLTWQKEQTTKWWNEAQKLQKELIHPKNLKKQTVKTKKENL